MKLILASQSPRRKELLSTLVDNFDIIPAQGEEMFVGNDIDQALIAVAKAKAGEVWDTHPDCAVLGADTIVWHEGKILGKPKNEQDAIDTLKSLSGQWHEVKTGVVLLSDQQTKEAVSTTRVRFRELSDEEIEAYVKSGKPMDKAGSYGIQETHFVDAIEGSRTNVIGLPLEILEDWGFSKAQPNF